MKSITDHNILNNIPVISITHKCLQAIKEIVKIAPQEAQWFQTVEPIVYKHLPGEVHLILSDKLYIPSQNTSATQVDTTSTMMIEFYRELQQEYSDQDTVNKKLAAMTCWCHSHHNMSPRPSSQDDTQFNTFISLAKDQGVESWQVMLIFNKKDQFYSRVYNPQTETIHEGVPIQVLHNYDFNYIHQAAKSKFKKPAPFKRKPLEYNNPFATTATNLKQTGFDFFPSYNQDYDLFDDSEINESIIVGFLTEFFENYNPYKSYKEQFDKIMVLTKNNLYKLYNSLSSNLDEKELVFTTYFLAKEKNKIPAIFLDNPFNKKFPKEEDIFIFFKDKLNEKVISLKEAYAALLKTLEITDLSTRKQCKEYIDNA